MLRQHAAIVRAGRKRHGQQTGRERPGPARPIREKRTIPTPYTLLIRVASATISRDSESAMVIDSLKRSHRSMLPPGEGFGRKGIFY